LEKRGAKLPPGFATVIVTNRLGGCHVGFGRSAIIRTTYETIKSTVLNSNKLPMSVKCHEGYS
jgi:hypothetical protein